ncbi:MAG TPA: hypothetical protein VL595_37285 [Pseudonocardia sp.]|nr:hypothetical protein [Pseudonocardia sp.]
MVAPGGALLFVITFEISGDRITSYEVIADRVRLARVRLGVLN